MAEARAEAEGVEAKLSALRQRVGLPNTSVTVDAVQNAIPPDSRLVEFFLYQPYDREQRRLGAGHYVAYILGPTGDPAWTELTAPADELDQALVGFRDTLRDPTIGITEVKRRARAVYDLVMRPVVDRLGISSGRLLISPDGQMNLLPFAALVDDSGDFLLERFSFTYLTSGRDLLRLQKGVPARHGSVVVANPEFRSSVTDAVAALPAQSEPREPHWAPLQGTETAAQRLLPSATVLFGPTATKHAVKRLESPDILHVVTHGVFMPAPLPSPPQKAGLGTRDMESLFSGVPQESSAEEAMLRSGLVLAAPAADSGTHDDGILRALEVAALNFFGTKLVVLSACDTGSGQVRTGEGVYGLRRALVMAGAESQIVSLWKVDEMVANRLFTEYYRALADGRGRGDALRSVQLQALSDPTLRHPYYWAAFVQGGAWSPVDEPTMTGLRRTGHP